MARSGKAKAELFLKDEGFGWAWDLYLERAKLAGQNYADMQTKVRKWPYEEITAIDMVYKLIRYGSMTPKQVEFLGRLEQRIAERPAREAKRAAEEAVAQPVPCTEERIVVRGTIVTMKNQENRYGTVAKMLVKHADGWKVWGTVPTFLSDARVGSTVEFQANIKPSGRDPKFGFFTRPAKARVVNERVAS